MNKAEPGMRDVVSDTRFGFLDRTVPAGRIFNPELIVNQGFAGDESDDGPVATTPSMLQALQTELAHAEEFVFSVAFIAASGLAPLKEILGSYAGRGVIITSRYLDFNEPDIFRELLQLTSDNPNIEVLVHEDVDHGFHAKGYIFRHDFGVTAIVGSSNLTGQALSTNQEWNLKFSALPGGDIVEQLDRAVERQRTHSVALTQEWISGYEHTRRIRVIRRSGDQFVEEAGPRSSRILPNVMQSDALEEILDVVRSGEKRAVVISATGTGKTILAALAARQLAPERMLFVVHSEQILKKAQLEFQRVLEAPDSEFGFYAGGHHDGDARYVFATIQTIAREDHLCRFARRAFDLIIVDEVHRSGAASYRRLIDHFRPKFLLGMTATPERTDGFNVFELFDYNVPYEIRLEQALNARMLVPFHYYGIADAVEHDQIKLSEHLPVDALTSPDRVDYIARMMQSYGHPSGVKGLIFCSGKQECIALSAALNQREVYGHPLRTRPLTGDARQAERDEAVRALQAGELDYLLTVNIFNEGIDIPEINQILFLRQTESSIIFTQQLGRGLRKAAGKDHVRVLDFIGNYQNNYLIPLALTGDNSGSVDAVRDTSRKDSFTVAGTSTVSFSRIAQDSILKSIPGKLVGKRRLRHEIQTLQNRLDAIPRLRDFYRFDSLDPYVLATTSKPRNYWSLLADLGFIEKGHGPTPAETGYLNFLSTELLSGLRPHEIILLQRLLVTGTLTRTDFHAELSKLDTRADDLAIENTERLLTFAFYNQQLREIYGDTPVITVEGDTYRLHPRFADLYLAYAPSTPGTWNPASFADHVDEVLATGLLLCKKRGQWRGRLVPGHRYDRREVCRLLGWSKNQESTMYGYKADINTGTCPIFVTHDKAAEVDIDVRYPDRLLSPSQMHWFSKHGRTLDSTELAPMIANQVTMPLFVKKSNSEGSRFFYLGVATSENPQQTVLPDKKGRNREVVTMDLTLASPIEQELFEYLNSVPVDARDTRTSTSSPS